MRDLMREKHGVGLAAPQIGINLRFFLWESRVVINPFILAQSYTKTLEIEGCLSWHGKLVSVSRHDWIDATWTDENNVNHRKILRGFDARVFQHEYDHLQGCCIFNKPNE
jgi:peptide deformylase